MSQAEDGAATEKEVIEPSEFDMAHLRHDLRQLYSNIGYDGMLQVFYEMIVGANACGEVILEERQKELNNGR